MAAESARIALRCEEAKSTCILNLEDCDLRKIPDAIYLLMRGVQLESAILSKNQLTTVPTKFGQKLVTITMLDLSFNKLSKLPMELSNLTRLQTFNLSNNSFTEFPPAIANLGALQRLDISHNQLYSIPAADISCSDTLKSVNLSFNCLKTIVDLKCFPGIREVDMTHNEVEDVGAGDTDFTAAPWVESIDLQDNPLKDESRSYLQSIIRLRILI